MAFPRGISNKYVLLAGTVLAFVDLLFGLRWL